MILALSASISSKANKSLVDAIEKLTVSGLNNYFDIFCQFFLTRTDFLGFFLVKKIISFEPFICGVLIVKDKKIFLKVCKSDFLIKK